MEHVLDMSMTAALFDHSDLLPGADSTRSILDIERPGECALHSLGSGPWTGDTCVKSGIEAE
jgi:hypothetical protein